MPARTPKANTKARLREDLRNHLMGYHNLTGAETRYKSYAELKALHDSVKPEGVRWCGISRTTTRRS